MRKTTCMADFSEVLHGINCLGEVYYKSECGTRFQSALDSIFEGFKLSSKVPGIFNTQIPHLQYNTYISCLSKHTKEQDAYGRLSMWRAHAPKDGVALVFNNAAFQLPAATLKIVLSPVSYLGQKEVEQEWDRITGNILESTEFLKSQDRKTITVCVLRMLGYAAISIKHPCFYEETEWRLVYSPGFGEADFLKKDDQSIQGIPQPIYRIDLSSIPGVETSTLIDRIIIGPTQYPHALCETFEDLLKQFGLEKPHVHASNIPLRT
jgi:Protein of unknown function (DUF2971)